MYESITTTRVRYAETDQMNVVYYGNYAQYFEIGRVESIRALGISYKKLEEMGILLPVVELHIKYLRSAHYDDVLTIKTTLKELPTAHRIEFHQEVYNEDNKLLTTGSVVLYFVDAASMKKTNIPAELSEKLKPYFE
jgi:acyl-CoA thioester hydrolase, YbgC/YbaW family